MSDAAANRLMRAGRFREALPIAERAVVGARLCTAGHGLLATILLQLGRRAQAEDVVVTALALEPGSAESYDGLAYVSMLLERHDRANALYRRAAESAPEVPRYWYNLACSERSLGRLAEAEAACDRCLALDAAQFPSYILRSELRVQTPSENHIDELQACLSRTNSTHARAYLGYALAKELDDVGRYDEAFAWFSRSAHARRSEITYDVSGDEQKLRRIAEVFSAAPPAGSGSDGERCIFIVGLPRSGTTLVERILSGLSGVRSNGETENVSRALSAAAAGTGDMFQRAAAANPRAIAENYSRLARLDNAERVIEKWPTNYLYLGTIRRALPNAAILCVSRSPLDSCFAMYRTLFGDAYPFTYDIEELARYYCAYARLMQHWRAAFGDWLREIVYEDLVREPRALGERLAQYCGLGWNDAALDIAGHPCVALTASAAQIRRPIYGTSSGRWRHYRAHLEPLISALRRHGTRLPDDA